MNLQNVNALSNFTKLSAKFKWENNNNSMQCTQFGNTGTNTIVNDDKIVVSKIINTNQY